MAAFGAFWAVWATALPLPDGANDKREGLAIFTGPVSVGLFAIYTVAVTAVVALSHGLLGRVVRPGELVPGGNVTRVVLTLGVLYFAVAVAWVVPWALPVLATMLWVCHLALPVPATAGDFKAPDPAYTGAPTKGGAGVHLVWARFAKDPEGLAEARGRGCRRASPRRYRPQRPEPGDTRPERRVRTADLRIGGPSRLATCRDCERLTSRLAAPLP